VNTDREHGYSVYRPFTAVHEYTLLVFVLETEKFQEHSCYHKTLTVHIGVVVFIVVVTG